MEEVLPALFQTHLNSSSWVILDRLHFVGEAAFKKTITRCNRTSGTFLKERESNLTPWTSGQPALIVNADDWGRDNENTDRTLECIASGVVSSVSAMVFMEDSERAAVVARERTIDAGLHLNFTTPFTAPNCSELLLDHQLRIAGCLRRHRLAQSLFYPSLVRSFEYVVSAQLDEYRRLYGAEPERLDGHHHMHLCANVLATGLLPPGTVVRRNFSFRAGEKSFGNRLYRQVVDRMLARRHHLTDFFFSLPPLEPRSRLDRIFSLAQSSVVELETHPVMPDEYKFLRGSEMRHQIGEALASAGGCQLMQASR